MPENFQGYDIDESKIPHIIRQIKTFGSAPYKVEFQGGEPLLNLSFVEHFVELMSKEVGIENVEFVIATSLSLLSDQVLSWAKNVNVSFSISLDGTQIVHDANRKHRLASSHKMVEDGVRRIKQVLGAGRIGTVTTVTKAALKNPHDIVNAHVAMGLTDLFVRPLSPYGFATNKHDQHYTVAEYVEFYEALLRYLIENFKRLGIIEHNATLHLRKIFNPSFNGYVDLKSPSGHFFGSMVFDYNGKVFGSDEARMLYKSYGIDSLALGDVSSDLHVAKNEELVNLLASSFISETPGCDDCAFQPYCGSDVMHHLSTQGDPVGDKALSSFCSYQKGTFDLLFRLLNEDDARTVLEEWLCG